MKEREIENYILLIIVRFIIVLQNYLYLFPVAFTDFLFSVPKQNI